MSWSARLACAAVVIALLPSTLARAVPPPNDACANASTMPIPATGGVVNGTTVDATHDGPYCGSTSSLDVYHTFQPSVTGPWRLSLCTTANEFDTVLSIHTGCPCTSANLVAGTTCQDDDCGPTGRLSEITVANLSSAQTYIVRVAQYGLGFGSPDAYTLLVNNLSLPGACCLTSGQCTPSATGIGECASGATFSPGASCTPNPCPQPPPNDLCSNATNLNSVASFPGTTFGDFQNCAAATSDGAATPSGGCNDAPNGLQSSIWYRYTPGSNGNLRMVVVEIDDDFDLYCVFSTGGDCANLTEVADPNCDGDGTSFGPETMDITRPVTAGTTYWLAVGNYGNTPSAGRVSVSISFTPTSGACCVNGVCSQTTPGGCSGSFQTLGISCSPNPCPQPITCCTGLVCTTVLLGACTSGGGAQNAAASCSPLPCVALGVCCRGSTCSSDAALQSQALCQASLNGAAAGAVFVSPATCGASHTSPCCYADYNKVNGRNVADIFSYLSDWFGHSGFAVSGSSGSGTPIVADIFAFLSDWFAGGCG